MFLRKSSCFNWLLSFQYNRCYSENIAASIRKLFHGDSCSEIRWKKVRWQNWMAVNFNVRKMYSTFERMDGCEHSIEIIRVTLKECIARTNFFWNILLLKELLQQWMTATFFCQNKYSTLLMDDCHSFLDKNRYTTSKDGWLQLEWWNK